MLTRKRLLRMAGLSLGLGLVGAAALTYATWPDNALGVYLHERRNREANIRALEWRVGQETEPANHAFYQAWLAEEKGDLERAIREFQSLRDGTPGDATLYLKSSLRLGLAYGKNGQSDQELAVYQGLLERYPGQSRLSQATYYLRRGDRVQARCLLDDALAQDARDGSLGSDRQFAVFLRTGLGPTQSEPSSSSP